MSEAESPIADSDITLSMFSDAETGGGQGEYQVLARKYRPRRFEDLIGQEAMVRTLRNAFETDRVAHAFMLTGVRGVGKTTTARLLSRALNFETDGEDGPSIRLDPPGRHCDAIMAGRHPDVLELDAASRTGVADMRDLLDGARYAPVSARFKVYVIDEVHMLSVAAFNALLKTLEEPPAHVKFIFATTEIRKVPVTVLSRCQRFDLKRLDAVALARHLGKVAEREGAKISEDGLALIARAAEGSVRDGLSILDQAIVQTVDNAPVPAEAVREMLGLGDRGRLLDAFEMAVLGKAKQAIAETDGQVHAGADPLVLLKDLLDIAAEVAAAQIAGDDYAPAAPKDWIERTRALAKMLSPAQISRLWQVLLSGYRDAQAAPDAATALRMVMLRLSAAASLPSPEDAARLLQAGATQGEDAVLPTRPSSAAAGEETAYSPSSFTGILDLLGQRREVLLKGEVERFVRPADTAYAHLRCALEPGAPSDLLRRLGLFLKRETGTVWVIDEGVGAGETFEARRERIRAEKIAEAAHEPIVKAALDALPGATITDVQQVGPISPDHDETTLVDLKTGARRRA